MKVKKIKITIKDRETVFKEVAEALAKARREGKVTAHNEISFNNIETLRKILTQKRIALLHAVKQHSPESIYELAKITNRDLKSVNTDVAILADLGLMSLETTKKERKKTKPIVEFSKLNVEIAF